MRSDILIDIATIGVALAAIFVVAAIVYDSGYNACLADNSPHNAAAGTKMEYNIPTGR